MVPPTTPAVSSRMVPARSAPSKTASTEDQQPVHGEAGTAEKTPRALSPARPVVGAAWPQAPVIRRQLYGAEPGSIAVKTDTGEEYTVIGKDADPTGTMLTLKGGLGDAPFLVYSDIRTYELKGGGGDHGEQKEPTPLESDIVTPILTEVPPPLPGPMSAPSKPAWKRQKDKSPEEIAREKRAEIEREAIGKYTGSIYKALNRYLRGTTNADERRRLATELRDSFPWDSIPAEGGSVAPSVMLDEAIRQQEDYEKKMAEAKEKVKGLAENASAWGSVWGRVISFYVAFLTQALAKLPPPNVSYTTRGVGLNTEPEFLKKHGDGQVVTDAAFMSTAYGMPFAKDSLVVIKLPADHPGRQVTDQSRMGANEAEILFPPGSGYKVVRTIVRKCTKVGVKEGRDVFEHAYPSALVEREFAHVIRTLVPVADLYRFEEVERIFFTELTLPPKTSATPKVQTKVRVGSSTDPAEREADRLADAVVSRVDVADLGAAYVSRPDAAAATPPLVEALLRQTSASAPAVGQAGGTVPAESERSLREGAGGGAALAPRVRRALEGALGADLSRVRVHEGERADALNERFSSQAFTYGHDIYFRDGLPSPSTTHGLHLLAHELAHVVQQDARS